MVKLGVNLDHVATIRQQRYTPYPDMLTAIKISEESGADSITMHLREDRRHIQFEDIKIARKNIKTKLNLGDGCNRRNVCDSKPNKTRFYMYCARKKTGINY